MGYWSYKFNVSGPESKRFLGDFWTSVFREFMTCAVIKRLMTGALFSAFFFFFAKDYIFQNSAWTMTGS